MKVKKSYYTTILFMAIFALGVLILFILTRNILNNSSAVLESQPSTAIIAIA